MTDTAEREKGRAEITESIVRLGGSGSPPQMARPSDPPGQNKNVVKIRLTIDTEDVEKGVESIIAGLKKIRRETREAIHAVKELERQVGACGQGDDI